MTCSSFGESTFYAWFRRKTYFYEKCGAPAGTPKAGEMELRAKDEERAGTRYGYVLTQLTSHNVDDEPPARGFI